MKKIIFLIFTFIMLGCQLQYEKESDIIISCNPSSSVLFVNENEEQDFSFNFKLESDTLLVHLIEIKVSYYDEFSLLSSKVYKGNYLSLQNLDNEKNFLFNLVTSEVKEALKTKEIINTTIIFTFESKSLVKKEVTAEVGIQKKVEE